MDLPPPVHHLLSDRYLSFIAGKIGDEWRQFFTHLGFETEMMHHWEYDNHRCRSTAILTGLHEWKKIPKKIPNRNIKELLDWIITALRKGERQDIADELKVEREELDIDKVIDRLSLKLTNESRERCLVELGISNEDITRAQKGKTKLKNQTTTLLENWHDEHLQKYWKYQDILTVLRTMVKNDIADAIIKECKILEYTEKTNDWSGTCRKENDIGTSNTSRESKNFNPSSLESDPSPPELKDQTVSHNINKRIHDYSRKADDEASPAKKVKSEDSQENTGTPAIHESTKQTTTVKTLRKYQEELAEIPLRGENCIICAVTNAGKTLVAFHIIEEHFRRNPNAKVVFMARTNPLLDQQYHDARTDIKCFEDSADIIKFSTGQQSTEETTRKMFEKGRLFFMTPQTLANRLNKDNKFPVKLISFSMLVFDECHHAIGGTPYNHIMTYYRQAKYGERQPILPQILGLTASVGTNRATTEESAVQHLVNLMTILDVKCLSTVRKNKADLKKYTSVPESDIMTITQRQTDPVRDELYTAIAKVEQVLISEKVTQFLNINQPDTNKLARSLKNPPFKKMEQTYIQWISESKIEIENFLKRDIFVPRLLLACFRHLEVYAGCLEINDLLDVDAVVSQIEAGYVQESTECKEANTSEEKELVKNLQSMQQFICHLNSYPDVIEKNPDVLKIIDILENMYKSHGENSRFFIFVKTRATAKAFAERLRDLKHLNCQYFTGSQVAAEYGGSSKETQLDILKKFKTGCHKCLVATAVASEGIDIPQCNLIIRYRFTASEITSVQMKGRIRGKDGKEVIFGSEKENLREMINLDRMFLMERAVEEMLSKEDSEIRELIHKKEEQLYKCEESEQRKSVESKQDKIEGEFEVNCRKCDKTIVLGHKIRILKGQHHLIFDLSVLKTIRRKEKKQVLLDDFKLTDRVFGACGHEWGHILIYSDCEFICLAQKRIKIFNVQKETFLNISKWQEVKFKINELTDEEVTEYKSQQ